MRVKRRKRIWFSAFVLAIAGGIMVYYIYSGDTGSHIGTVHPLSKPELERMEKKIPAERVSVDVSYRLVNTDGTSSTGKVPDRDAEFPWGTKSLNSYFANLVNCASLKGSNTRIRFRFTIKANGQAVNPRELNSGVDPACMEEIARTIRELPYWNPAIRKGVQAESLVELDLFIR